MLPYLPPSAFDYRLKFRKFELPAEAPSNPPSNKSRVIFAISAAKVLFERQNHLIFDFCATYSI